MIDIIGWLLCIVAAVGINLWFYRLGMKKGLDANVHEEISRRQRSLEMERRKYEGIIHPGTRSAVIKPTASRRSQAEVDEDSR